MSDGDIFDAKRSRLDHGAGMSWQKLDVGRPGLLQFAHFEQTPGEGGRVDLAFEFRP